MSYRGMGQFTMPGMGPMPGTYPGMTPGMPGMTPGMPGMMPGMYPGGGNINPATGMPYTGLSVRMGGIPVWGWGLMGVGVLGTVAVVLMKGK